MKLSSTQIMKYYIKNVNTKTKDKHKLDYAINFDDFLINNKSFFTRILKLEKKEIVKLLEFFEYEIEQLKKRNKLIKKSH